MTSLSFSSNQVFLIDYPTTGGEYISKVEATQELDRLSMLFGEWNQSGVELDRQNLLNLYIDNDPETGRDPIVRFWIADLPALQPGEASAPFNLGYILRRGAISADDSSWDRETTFTLSVKFLGQADGSVALVTAGAQEVLPTLTPEYISPESGSYQLYKDNSVFSYEDGEVLGIVSTLDHGGAVFDFEILNLIGKQITLANLYSLYHELEGTGNTKEDMLDAENYYIEVSGLPIYSADNTALGQIEVTVPIDDNPNQPVQSLNYPPVITSSGSVAIDENVVVSTTIYTPAVIDPDGETDLSFQLSGADASSFSLNEQSGEVVLAVSPDYETKSSYVIALAVTDASSNETVRSITVNINDLDEISPMITSAGTVSVVENSGAGQVVYTLEASDEASITYSITGEDASAFSVNETSGGVTLVADPDFEQKSQYTFTAVATDSAGNYSEKSVTLAVTNVDDTPPSFSSVDSVELDENGGANQLIYTAVTVDESEVAYSLTGTDAALFSIDSQSGELRLISSPNYESQPQYSLNVVAEDGAGLSAVLPLTLTVNNQNDPPMGSDRSLQVESGGEHLFSVDDFGFLDEDEGDQLVQLRIDAFSLGEGDRLELDGVAVVAETLITLNDLNNEKLSYHAADDSSGIGQASLTFSLYDGALYSEASSTITLNVGDYSLGGSVRHWKNSVAMDGVLLSIGQLSDISVAGSFNLAAVPDPSVTLSASLSGISSTNENNPLDAWDAYQAWALTVPSVANTVFSSGVDAYNYLAADFDNSGGVDAFDAFLIWAYTIDSGFPVGTTAAEDAIWKFLDSDDKVTLQSSVNNFLAGTAEAPDLNLLPAIDLDLASDVDVDVVGVLLGDVDGSWVPA